MRESEKVAATTQIEFEARVFTLRKKGYLFVTIATELGKTRHECVKAFKTEEGRRKRRKLNPPTRAELAERIMDLADIASARANEPISSDDLSKCIKAACLCTDQVARLHGLYAPVKTESESTTNVLVVTRSEQHRLMADPEFRRMQAELEAHAINCKPSETHDAHWIRSQSEAREVSLPAPHSANESQLHEAGEPGDHESVDACRAAARQDGIQHDHL